MVDVSELPEPWATWATRVGVRPSMTGIGEAAGLPASTISRLVRGRTSEATVRTVAQALRLNESELLAALGQPDGLGMWQPPLEAHLLTTEERDALGVLIRSIVKGRGGQTDGRTLEAEKITASSQGDVTLAARPGSSDVDRYRQSIANVGEETQLTEDDEQ